MSSTTFSGQMSSLRPSALSQTGVDSEYQDSSSSASLSFLVVLLAVFIILVIGGGASSYMLTRMRRQTVGASGKHITQLIKQTPKMCDVRTASSQPDSLEAKGQWKYLNPLSVQSFPNSCIHADQLLPLHQPVRLPLRRAQDVLLRQPKAPARLIVIDTNSTPPPPAPVADPEMKVQVAVLIKMPSPQNRHRSLPDISNGEEELREWRLGEYVIGTTRTHVVGSRR